MGCSVCIGLKSRAQGDLRGGCPRDSTLSHSLSYHRQAGDQLAAETTLYNLSCLRWLDMFLCERVFLLCTILYSRMKSKSDIKELINYSPSSIN